MTTVGAMKTSMHLLIGAFAIAALSTSCKKKADDGGGNGKAVENTGDNKGGDKPTGGSVTLNGSGSTFQKSFDEVCIEAFTKANAGAQINYAGGGSGKGRKDLGDMVVDFAGTDSPFKDEEAKNAKGGDLLYFPILLGAVTISYNLDGVDKLQLSAETAAKIFQRDIKKWNDPAIAADNPSVKLPDTDIVVAHRGDGSGTTDIFTKFLDGGSNGTWKHGSGSTVEWPTDTQAGQGNGGVAQIVKSTGGAVGYVDLSDAKQTGLHYAAIKNGAGKYVEADAASVSAAGEGIDIKDNLTFSAVNAKGDGAYPITGQTWIVVYAKQTDKAKGDAIKSFLKYVLTDGQKLATDVDYAPLPKAITDKAIAQLDKIKT